MMAYRRKRETERPKQKISKRRKDLYAAARGRCGICGKSIPIETTNLDHIIPKAQGGKSSRANLQIACRACNSMKAALTPGQFREVVQRIAKNLNAKED